MNFLDKKFLAEWERTVAPELVPSAFGLKEVGGLGVVLPKAYPPSVLMLYFGDNWRPIVRIGSIAIKEHGITTDAPRSIRIRGRDWDEGRLTRPRRKPPVYEIQGTLAEDVADVWCRHIADASEAQSFCFTFNGNEYAFKAKTKEYTRRVLYVRCPELTLLLSGVGAVQMREVWNV